MWKFNGKTYSTVAGLCKAIMKDADAIEVTGVRKDRTIAAFRSRNDIRPVEYSVSAPDPLGVKPMTVTRI